MPSATLQPKQTPADDSRAALVFGICDRLFDHGHCVSDVVLVPADADGRPDYSRADPANVEALPADEWPANDLDADRTAVIVDHVDGCSKDSSFLIYLTDNQPQVLQIHGPAEDRVIGESIIGRDIGARPVQPPPSKLADSFAKLVDDIRAPAVEVSPMMPALAAIADKFERRHEAANDNEPKHDERLIPYMQAFGGTIRGTSLFGATYNGKGGQIWLMDGKAVFWTDKGAESISLPEKAEALTFLNPADWHGKPIPQRAWYAEGLIPLRQVTILNGDGGVGKSLLALQIAAAGALGVGTLDIDPAAGRVLYVGAEDEADEFHRRLVDISKAYGKDLRDLLNFRLLPLADRDALLSIPDQRHNMQPTQLWASIVDQAGDFRPRLIVLDTAADLFGGDEIKRGQVRQFIAMLRQVAIGLDCAVVLLAHPSVQGMQTGTGSSGSTAWNNSVRSRLYMTRPDGKDADPDLRVLRTMKANYGTTGGEIKLRWKNGVFVLDDGKPHVGATLMAAKAERVFCHLLSLFNRTGQNVSDVTGTSYAPAKMAKHPDADGISKKSLADAMQRLIDRGEIKIVLEGPPSRQRKRLVLASEDYGSKDNPA